METRRQFLKHIPATVAVASGVGLLNSSKASANVTRSDEIPFQTIRPGATIGLIAPATAVDRNALEWAVSNTEKLGFRVKLGRNVYKSFGYLAGTDQERADDVNSMFADDSVDAIWCLKGGWGCARILDLLDYDLIRRNPKAIIGYSDVTSLLTAIHKRTGLITLHGPNAIFGESDYSKNLLFDLLFDEGSKTIYSHEQAEPYTVRSGVASGKAVGGNLTVLTTLLGTEYEPNFDGGILFLEDVSEPAYKVDRMLTHLKMSGALENINGVIWGTCRRCSGSEDAFTIEEVVEMHFRPLGVPVMSGLSIGHILHKMTIPVGAYVRMDADRHTIELSR